MKADLRGALQILHVLKFTDVVYAEVEVQLYF